MQILKRTKLVFFITLFLGALLIAKLFLFSDSHSASTSKIKKPSELDFSRSNQLIAVDSTSPNSTTSTQSSDTISSLIQSFNSEDKLKWNLFKNILLTKNDNDPHLDKELVHLSETFHKALIEKYDLIPAENRNERGLIVFLISRDLHLTEDFQFLKQVYQEAPCLSLENCKTLGIQDPHHNSVNETTLTYPQQAALYQIEKKLIEEPRRLSDINFRNEIIQILIQAENFSVPVIQEKARQLRLKFGL